MDSLKAGEVALDGRVFKILANSASSNIDGSSSTKFVGASGEVDLDCSSSQELRSGDPGKVFNSSKSESLRSGNLKSSSRSKLCCLDRSQSGSGKFPSSF